MESKDFIPVINLCTHYEVAISFFDELHDVGLIKIVAIEQKPCLHCDHLNRVERIIRLYKELNVNIEGIDVIFNLLGRIKVLEAELQTTQNKLLNFEEEDIA